MCDSQVSVHDVQLLLGWPVLVTHDSSVLPGPSSHPSGDTMVELDLLRLPILYSMSYVVSHQPFDECIQNNLERLFSKFLILYEL